MLGEWKSGIYDMDTKERRYNSLQQLQENTKCNVQSANHVDSE